MTTQEIMKELGMENAIYDTSKPQPWMDMMRDRYGFDYQDLYLNYVWLYDEKSPISGRPFNYMAAYARHIMKQQEDGYLQIVQVSQD